MQHRSKKLLSMSSLALAAGLMMFSSSAVYAQAAKKPDEKAPAPTIDAQTGKVLNEAIELLNMENWNGAQAKLGTLNLEKLSPYERSKVEQILFSISYSQEKYDDARGHLQKAIAAGGFNEQEVQTARFQGAQLYIMEDKWKEGAAALEEWFKTAATPNSAAYYMLAVAYYNLNEFDKALPPAQKAVELMDKPNEAWMSTLYALYMQKERFKDAVPLLERLVAFAPQKKAYWLQLSNVYGVMEDYGKALGVMQLAYNMGLVTEDSEYRRLADLLVFNEVPYRGAQILESGIEKKVLNLDDKLYEKLANCWIAAAEFDKAIAPLQRAGELSATGEVFARLGEVQIQREDYPAAIVALQKGIDKGQLKDVGQAQLMLGIAYFNSKDKAKAKEWLERAAKSEKHKKDAASYLQLL